MRRDAQRDSEATSAQADRRRGRRRALRLDARGAAHPRPALAEHVPYNRQVGA